MVFHQELFSTACHTQNMLVLGSRVTFATYHIVGHVMADLACKCQRQVLLEIFGETSQKGDELQQNCCDVCQLLVENTRTVADFSKELSILYDKIDLYPLLRNDDVWGTVGINWKQIACEWRDYNYSSMFFLRVSAVFYCLLF